MRAIDVIHQPGMVLAQRLDLTQLFQPLLLLDIVPTGVGIGGDRLRESSLERAVSRGKFWLYGGLDASTEVRFEEMKRGSAHPSRRVSLQYKYKCDKDGVMEDFRT